MLKQQLDCQFFPAGVDAVMYDIDPILPCLRQIIFDNNPIESIEKNLFYGLRESNLQEISLVNCQLKEIHASKYKQSNTTPV